ncbi:hypothetical protein [Kitasatospora cathayae]|uniref:Uncharacterized protein n=1 Tax=Kitasatospora cathayae TaxID=3004092 RepID=A0ABY7PXF7_9ACTN|nr:hypothetical protein [Kitasatospora sp. HUAS 3-15]WBP85118.1 hypothetical protein O1G21_04135 [Kitasatospora sp. HUAS 3-15]
MCSQCAQRGPWARPESGLGVFLEMLLGLGLLYQLQRHTEPDPDDHWDPQEMRAAAGLLRTDPVDGIEDDEESGEEEDGEPR